MLTVAGRLRKQSTSPPLPSGRASLPWAAARRCGTAGQGLLPSTPRRRLRWWWGGGRAGRRRRGGRRALDKRTPPKRAKVGPGDRALGACANSNVERRQAAEFFWSGGGVGGDGGGDGATLGGGGGSVAAAPETLEPQTTTRLRYPASSLAVERWLWAQLLGQQQRYATCRPSFTSSPPPALHLLSLSVRPWLPQACCCCPCALD